jgi:hypothetical protein
LLLEQPRVVCSVDLPPGSDKPQLCRQFLPQCATIIIVSHKRRPIRRVRPAKQPVSGAICAGGTDDVVVHNFPVLARLCGPGHHHQVDWSSGNAASGIRPVVVEEHKRPAWRQRHPISECCRFSLIDTYARPLRPEAPPTRRIGKDASARPGVLYAITGNEEAPATQSSPR